VRGLGGGGGGVRQGGVCQGKEILMLSLERQNTPEIIHFVYRPE
jgi:hypothetical protein